MKNIIILFFISNLMTTISHAGPSLSLCFDGNCETKKLVNISDEDWSNILEIFTLPIAITEEAERECITKAIPLIEKLSLTKLAQTTVDSYSASDLYNSMNSRDQTLNYKAYIRLLSDHHVIQYHSLRKTEHRSSWIGITEYSIIIQDRTSGELYALDASKTDYFESPEIHLLKDWKNKKSIKGFTNKAIDALSPSKIKFKDNEQ